MAGVSMRSQILVSSLVIATALVACRGQESSESTRSETKNRLAYEMTERCGKRTDELFKRDFGDGVSRTKSGQSMSGFQSHYSAKLNKCFQLLTTNTYENKTGSVMIVLSDVNENRQYGTFFRRFQDSLPFECVVEGTHCTSNDAWQVLIKPYMED